MTEELKKEQDPVDNERNETSSAVPFTEIKEVASKNIGQMLQDLQAFETAIEKEDIPEIYRIYNGRLHKELKETSNQNHEIDELLARKIHDSFVATFPFMIHAGRISPTVHYYKIGEYYHERPTIGIDASVPEIFVIPAIDDEWRKFQRGNRDMLTAIEQQMDNLDAKAIAAQSEIQKLQEEIDRIKRSENELSESKGFFNRGKIDEELEALVQERKKVEAKQKEWSRYSQNEQDVLLEKERLMQQYHALRLKKAIVEKEFRQIDHYFGSLQEMNERLQAFLMSYLGEESIADE
ncbi:hypothetical protein [Enterococcus gallinarum]|uniref:hypothetical protein n=1 Tax=Enterococcus gallinarum TaxID=1353 RepID=UPI0018AB6915|nr:hypothetical protein [Enterococcus gallinarum]